MPCSCFWIFEWCVNYQNHILDYWFITVFFILRMWVFLILLKQNFDKTSCTFAILGLTELSKTFLIISHYLYIRKIILWFSHEVPFVIVSDHQIFNIFYEVECFFVYQHFYNCRMWKTNQDKIRFQELSH